MVSRPVAMMRRRRPPRSLRASPTRDRLPARPSRRREAEGPKKRGFPPFSARAAPCQALVSAVVQRQIHEAEDWPKSRTSRAVALLSAWLNDPGTGARAAIRPETAARPWPARERDQR